MSTIDKDNRDERDFITILILILLLIAIMCLMYYWGYNQKKIDSYTKFNSASEDMKKNCFSRKDVMYFIDGE